MIKILVVALAFCAAVALGQPMPQAAGDGNEYMDKLITKFIDKVNSDHLEPVKLPSQKFKIHVPLFGNVHVLATSGSLTGLTTMNRSGDFDLNGGTVNGTITMRHLDMKYDVATSYNVVYDNFFKLTGTSTRSAINVEIVKNDEGYKLTQLDIEKLDITCKIHGLVPGYDWLGNAVITAFADVMKPEVIKMLQDQLKTIIQGILDNL